MREFYNRTHFRADDLPPYVWGFDLLETYDNCSEALDAAGIGGLYELVGALIVRGGGGMRTAEEIEDIVVRLSAEPFRPLVRHVLQIGTLMGEWADYGAEGVGLTLELRELDDPTPFVPWWGKAA